jgi:hypothetical protein
VQEEGFGYSPALLTLASLYESGYERATQQDSGQDARQKVADLGTFLEEWVNGKAQNHWLLPPKQTKNRSVGCFWKVLVGLDFFLERQPSQSLPA